MKNGRTYEDFMAWLNRCGPLDEVRISEDNRALEGWRDGEQVAGIVIRQGAHITPASN